MAEKWSSYFRHVSDRFGVLIKLSISLNSGEREGNRKLDLYDTCSPSSGRTERKGKDDHLHGHVLVRYLFQSIRFEWISIIDQTFRVNTCWSSRWREGGPQWSLRSDSICASWAEGLRPMLSRSLYNLIKGKKDPISDHYSRSSLFSFFLLLIRKKYINACGRKLVLEIE